MFNFVMVLTLVLNSNNDLPVLKIPPTVSAEINANVNFKVASPRKNPNIFYYEEIPVAKETETYEIVTARQFHPVKRAVNALRRVLPDPIAIQRSGTVVYGNNGNPVVVEEKIVTKTTTVESKKSPAHIKEEEEKQKSEDEPKYLIYEDRRVFSGRVRNRIFIGRR